MPSLCRQRTAGRMPPAVWPVRTAGRMPPAVWPVCRLPPVFCVLPRQSPTACCQVCTPVDAHASSEAPHQRRSNGRSLESCALRHRRTPAVRTSGCTCTPPPRRPTVADPTASSRAHHCRSSRLLPRRTTADQTGGLPSRRAPAPPCGRCAAARGCWLRQLRRARQRSWAAADCSAR